MFFTKDASDPVRCMAFDRLLGPRKLGGPRRSGAPKMSWAEAIIPMALVRLGSSSDYRDE
eukprot:14672461-Alexandrium_andersonii.AAC.1